MASPPRPNFFSRASASFQTHAPSPRQGQQGNLSTSDSGSFADEPRSQEPVVAEKKKKKGFKGFLQKLGGGNKKRSSDGSERDRAGRAEDDYSTPLPPPPSLSVLMERSDRSSKHTRSPSNSSLSGSMAQTPGSQIANGRPSYSNDQTQQRSVSAPMVKSPSKSSLPNTSPTSSRYPYGRDNFGNGNASGYQRDSYASSSTGRRRSSIPGLFNGAGPESVDDRRMDATVEVLEGEDGREYRSNGWNEDAAQYPPARFSQDRGGPGSMTNSSGTLLAPSIETPMMGSVPAMQAGRSPYSRSASDNQKTLPPLPAQQGDYSLQQDYPSPLRSPDSFNAFFGQGTTMSPNMNQPPAPYNAHGRTPSSGQRSFASGVSFKDEPQRAHKTKSKLDFEVSFPEVISKVLRRMLSNTVNNTALKLPERATLTTWLEQNLLDRNGPHRQLDQPDHPSCRMEDDLCASLTMSAPGARITSNERSFHDRHDTTRRYTGIYDLSTYAKQ
jgi:hypothetical protein